MIVTPCRVQALDQREELVGFGAGQVAGRLVEHQKPRAPAGGAGGRDKLLLADGQVAERRVGRQVEAQFVKDGLGAPRHLPLAQQAEAGGLVAEEDVGGDRQVRAQHDFLMDGVDAQRQGFLGAGELDLPALPQDGAGGLGIDPVSSLISVDLPAPFSPTMAWTSPGMKLRLTAFSAWVPANFLVEHCGSSRVATPW